jgi:hypothetical protein
LLRGNKKYVQNYGGRNILEGGHLKTLYASPDTIRVIKSREMRWKGCVVQRREMKKAHKTVAEKTEEKSPLGRPSCRREDNIRMDLNDMG